MAEVKESRAAKRKREREEGNRGGRSGRLADNDENYSLELQSPDDGVAIKSDQDEGGGEGTGEQGRLEPVADSSPTRGEQLAVPSVEEPPQTRSRRTKVSPPADAGPFSARSAPLTVLTFNTTQDLWRELDQLALDVTELGRKVSVSEVIRIVLAAQLPDLSTDEGKAEALELAATWTKERVRGQREAKFSVIRLRLPMVTALKRLALDAKKAGASLEPSPLISGVLNTSDLTAGQILQLNDEEIRTWLL